jgi:hypothetical protein
MQKDESVPWHEYSGDCRKRAIEVVDVREAEAGDDSAKCLSRENRRTCGVGLDIADA